MKMFKAVLIMGDEPITVKVFANSNRGALKILKEKYKGADIVRIQEIKPTMLNDTFNCIMDFISDVVNDDTKNYLVYLIDKFIEIKSEE